MAQPDDSKDAASDDKGEAAPAPVKAGLLARLTGNRKILFGALGALLLLGGGGGWMMLSGGKDEDTEAHAKVEVDPAIKPIEVPPIVVNLRTSDGSANFLKLRVAILPANAEAEEKLTAALPRVIDSYQPFLRELRPEDVAGSGALFRVKEELALRTQAIGGKGSVADVLIQDLIQQ